MLVRVNGTEVEREGRAENRLNTIVKIRIAELRFKLFDGKGLFCVLKRKTGDGIRSEVGSSFSIDDGNVELFCMQTPAKCALG